MRLIHTIILALLLSPNIIFGQTDSNIEFGLKLGANYTMPKMVDLSSMEFNNQAGMDLGIFTGFRFSDHLGLKVEILYSSQNIHMKSYGIGDGNGRGIGTAELNKKVNDEYLLLPILFKFKLVKKLDFLIGPQFGYLLSNQRRFLVVDNIIYFQNEQLDNFSMSGDFELSFKSTDKLSLGIRYFLGLNKVNSLRNNGLQFYLGYAIL